MMNLFAQEWFTVPLFGISVFVVTYLWADRILGFLYARSLGHREHVISRLELMFVPIDRTKITASMLLMSFGLGALAFFAVWPSVVGGLILGSALTIFGWNLPKFVVEYLYVRRCGRFTDQMVDGISMMANGIRSGLTAQQSMDRVAENMPNPIRQEFKFVTAQMKVGLSFEEALNGLAQRIPNPDVQMFVLAINILKETGGNLAETFTTIVETIRDRQKVEKKIEALTAQGIMQGIIISCVPFILMGVYLVVDPNFIKPLFTTTIGIVCLVIMLTLQILGGLMIRSIVKIKV
ncbi:MAG: type II secretion system F family protein [Bdellovibrionia bacterium]